MELVYVYIVNYRNIIVDREYSFSSNHVFKYNKENSSIDLISQKEVITSDFFSKKIVNISCIVGENGVGKSSFLKFLLDELVDGNQNQISNFCSIWWNKETDAYFEYSNYTEYFSEQKIKLNFDCGTKTSTLSNLFINYYPLFDDKFSNPYLSNEIGKWINLCDNSLFGKDYEYYTKQNRLTLSGHSLGLAANMFKIGNIKRELNYFHKSNFESIPKPKYIAMTLNNIDNEIENAFLSVLTDKNSFKKGSKSSKYYIDLLKLNYILNFDKSISNIKQEREFFIVKCCFVKLFLNSFTLFYNFENKTIKYHERTNQLTYILDELLKLDVKRKDSYLGSLNNLKKYDIQDFGISSNADAIENLLLLIDEITEKEESSLTNFLTTRSSKDIWNSYHLTINFVKKESLVNDFLLKLSRIKNIDIFHFQWISANYDDHYFSTGEQHFLKLFSRLIYATETIKNHDSYKHGKSIILLLDESELGLHPRWQQQFIKWLCDFIDVQFESQFKIQIILATHSPIMLSDIPCGNVVKLRKNQSIPYNNEQTFCANIHNLFADSFFLDEGLIGFFAKKKLEDLIDHLKTDENRKYNKVTALNLIELVGEPIIRNRLEDLYENKYGKTKEYLTVLSNRLKDELEEINKQLLDDTDK